MNQPPLNPDALEAASRTVHPGYWKLIDKYPEERIAQKSKSNLIEEARSTVSAYLAAALPEVTNVEELEALPAKTVILDSHGDVSVITETGLFMCDDGDCYELDEVADDLPARVLYRPSERP